MEYIIPQHWFYMYPIVYYTMNYISYIIETIQYSTYGIHWVYMYSIYCLYYTIDCVIYFIITS